MANRVLRITHKGADVIAAQTKLAQLGLLEDGDVDGVFGAGTARAVLAFQKGQGLAEDAVIGPKTADALERAVAELVISLSSALETGTVEGAEDPGGPYLFFDLYAHDLDDPKTAVLDVPPFDRLAAVPGMTGGILKATQGTRYSAAEWFVRSWKALCGVGSPRLARYGKTWFAGAYHYLEFLQNGADQADFYCNTVEKALGCGSEDWNGPSWWDDPGLIKPIVDIEFGGERSRNRRASTAQIIDTANAFSDRVKKRTGRGVMLYSRGALRDRKIVDKLGCETVWNPSYTETMVTNGLVTVDGKPGPWKLSDIALWQYGGDGVGDDDKHKLPLTPAGFAIDMSVHIAGSAKPSLSTLRATLL